MKKLLIIQAAAMSETPDVYGLEFHRIRPVFPAVTCVAQASMRTGVHPERHGMVGNFRMIRELSKPLFWEQSAGLIDGERIWRKFRQSGRKIAMLFWQQSLGEDVDIVLSPAPIHKHHGGMIMDCHSVPADLYSKLKNEFGPFKLREYWGPMASSSVGEWIIDATLGVLGDPKLSPDLCLTYLPTLDYDLQRGHPVDDPKSVKARAALTSQLHRLIGEAVNLGYDIVAYGDYRITPVAGAAFPNRTLLRSGLMTAREVKGMLYTDLHHSRAFAVVDHQVGHVYVKNQDDVKTVKDVLEKSLGIGSVETPENLTELRVAHPNSGELIVLAEPDHWLAYPWWSEKRRAPDYASHVDIHNKPGYDPCELFWGWPPGSTGSDPSRVKGSHGLVGDGTDAVWASTLEFSRQPESLVDLSLEIKKILDRTAEEETS